MEAHQAIIHPRPGEEKSPPASEPSDTNLDDESSVEPSELGDTEEDVEPDDTSVSLSSSSGASTS